MDDVQRLVAEFGGEVVAGVVIVYEDGVHREAARQVEGVWVVSEAFVSRLAPVAAPIVNKARAK